MIAIHNAFDPFEPVPAAKTELGKQNEYFVVRIDLAQNLDIERANPVEVIILSSALSPNERTLKMFREPDPLLNFLKASGPLIPPLQRFEYSWLSRRLPAFPGVCTGKNFGKKKLDLFR